MRTIRSARCMPRCGCRRSCARYSAKLSPTAGLPIEARVGVNTGEVVVRSITTGDGHSRVHADRAYGQSRLADADGRADRARSRSARTRASCARATSRSSRWGRRRVKGVSEPVNVYEVTGLGPLRTRLQRSAGRGLTKFVGREREMEAMRAAAERARAGHGQIVAAMAEAGTGKSRLFFEFKATHQSGWMVLETFSVSHGKASAYLPVLDLLHGYFRITREDDERTRREKVTGRIVALDRSLGRYAAVPVRPARDRRGRRSAGADGRADQEAAHARRDQADSAARSRSISR